MRRLLLPLTALLALLALLAPVAAHAAVKVGIADNKADMFGDPRYQALHLGYARLDLRWDVLSDPVATAGLDAWMRGAQATGARPLITFDRSPRRPAYNPTPAQLAAALKALRARYPFVKDFSSWNEANMNKKPELVAAWYLALRRACPSCDVLATDLLDKANMVSWARRFVKAAKRTPKVWGLHNYVDANTLSTKTTKKLLASVGGNVWLTETGGIVRRSNASAVVFPTGAAHAAKVTKFIFDKLVRLSPRIQRVYLYHWDTGTEGGPTWDSGFVGPDDQPRPALTVLQRYLGVKPG
ncbi:MAG TPA: hypothetical protein VFG42_07855 [Baekduia sp.]|uniref:hypothetical protein n=1 Tax=Baekduia sp. TaxID=2600305 RepID=UPI002D7877BC|nr:hypothetical protein [Baekduia sp.]HET6506688.1 hypothetical protein [Baekduia sp.]